VPDIYHSTRVPTNASLRFHISPNHNFFRNSLDLTLGQGVSARRNSHPISQMHQARTDKAKVISGPATLVKRPSASRDFLDSCYFHRPSRTVQVDSCPYPRLRALCTVEIDLVQQRMQETAWASSKSACCTFRSNLCHLLIVARVATCCRRPRLSHCDASRNGEGTDPQLRGRREV